MILLYFSMSDVQIHNVDMEIMVDPEEEESFRDSKLRPVWNPYRTECNVANCNFKASTFKQYSNHWSKIHTEYISVHRCQLCDRTFRTYNHTKRHIAFLHHRTHTDPLIIKDLVRNYSFRDPHNVLPYRKGTASERMV